MNFKKQYTHEEIEEVVAWFEKHQAEVPQTLNLDKATHIPDFPSTLHTYIEIARTHCDNPTYSGQIYTLFRMRDAMLQAAGSAE